MYNSSNVKIYKDLEAVKKRPGMYIGNTEDGSGLHRMVFEIIDNSIDESLSGQCDKIEINIFEDKSVSITDNGRGMPLDYYKDDKKSVAEIIMTTLHSGAKFDDDAYNLSGGLHGVGVSVVNALSKELKLNIYRYGLIYEQLYEHGKPIKNISIIGQTDKKGTSIVFLFNKNIFKTDDFDVNIIMSRIKELSYLNPNINIDIKDFRENNILETSFKNNNGILSFMDELNKNKKVINEDIIFFSGKKNNINVNTALQWIDSEKEIILCYTNNIRQKEGGSHLIGFKTAITKILKAYLEYQFLRIKNKITVQSEDIREGLVSIIAIYMPNPKFSSQIKDKLISSEVKNIVEFITSACLKKYLYQNPLSSKNILNKIILSAKNRDLIKQTKYINKKNEIDINQLIKLADCQEKNPSKSELFIVEGDSAGGSAKQARDKKFQAVLPLKGKILNVERSSVYKMLSNTELKSIISVLKCNVFKNAIEKKNPRYHKIIFMTDADIDGSHIRTLLLTFFYRHMNWLIEDGHIFISKPPLYKLQKENHFFYIKDKYEFNDFLYEQIYKELSNTIKKENYLLKEVIELYKKISNIIENISLKYPKRLFEKLYFLTNEEENENNKISYEDILNDSKENNQKFEIKNNLDKKKIEFFFFKDGIKKKYNLDFEYLNPDDFFLIKNFGQVLKTFFNKIESIIFLEKNYKLNDFDKLIEIIKNKIMKKYTMQRYKGLGEMNPDQLWDTTMNPDTRNLYRININDIKDADNIFINLMGENINERKIFIEKYSGSIMDLDI